MAEAVAKHFKEFLLGAQPAVRAAIEAAALAPSPSPVPTAPILALTPAPATPVSFQRQDSAHIAPAMQTAPLPVRGDESLGDAARHEKHQKAYLELAKENPSVACK